MTVPEGWADAAIAEIVSINPKHDPAIDRQKIISFVPMPAVNEHSGTITELIKRRLSDVWHGFTHFANGDVIFAKITPCMENGKAAVADGLINGIACGSTEFFVFRPEDGIDAKYLWRLIRQKSFREAAAQRMTGAVGQRRVPRQYLEEYRIELPPAAEQRRIAAKLDALTSRLARSRAELDRIPMLANALRQHTLEQAFKGMLSTAWRAKNPLAEPIVGRQTEQLRTKYRGASNLAEPYELPDRWLWLRLPDLGNLDRGKSRHRPRNDPRLFGGDHPFIQTGEVRSASQYISTYNVAYSEFGLLQSRKWPVGTVCITIAANIAESAVLGIPACFPDSVVGFEADVERTIPEFIEYFIRTARSDLSRFAPATAQKNINLDTLAAIAVPVPPLEEQAEIVEKIEAAFARAARLETEAMQARVQLGRLENMLLAKAFRGELVLQDPNDEPASVLLKRIRMQRAATPGVKRRRQSKMST